VLTEAELAAAEAELKALQRHAFEIVHPEPGWLGATNSGIARGGTEFEFFWCPHSRNARNFEIWFALFSSSLFSEIRTARGGVNGCEFQ
jgi:hypothetical protein